jgi:hypothetical protein
MLAIREAPKSKLQIPKKFQAPNSKRAALSSLIIGALSFLGPWSFVI